MYNAPFGNRTSWPPETRTPLYFSEVILIEWPGISRTKKIFGQLLARTLTGPLSSGPKIQAINQTILVRTTNWNLILPLLTSNNLLRSDRNVQWHSWNMPESILWMCPAVYWGKSDVIKYYVIINHVIENNVMIQGLKFKCNVSLRASKIFKTNCRFRCESSDLYTYTRLSARWRWWVITSWQKRAN